MQQDPLEGLKKHYRGAWRGTVAGILFIVLLVLFVGEVSFSELFVGPRSLRKMAFNLAAGSCLLAFLLLKDRKNTQPIDQFRLPLIVSAVSYLLLFWLFGVTNRVGRNQPQHLYQQTFTVESMLLKTSKKSDSETSSPAYWRIKVQDDLGRPTTFSGALDQFDLSMLGQPIILPVIHGRWGQDFIVESE